MAQQQVQTRENHARLHPPFHIVFALIILLLFGIAVYELVRNPGLVTAAQVLLVVAVGMAGLFARTYALKVQDRLIRLEERLRLSAVLPERLHPMILGLSEQQLIALRFASDIELVALAERANAEKLDQKTIKAAIQNWRPDHWRV